MLNISKKMLLLNTILTFGSGLYILHNCVDPDTFMINPDMYMFIHNLDISIMRLITEFFIITVISEHNIILITNDNIILTDNENIISITCSIIFRLFCKYFPYDFQCIHYINGLIIFTSLFISMMLVIEVENINMKKIYNPMLIYLKLI
jgi:hypothetical protein